jgi:hypothetical protein
LSAGCTCNVALRLVRLRSAAPRNSSLDTIFSALPGRRDHEAHTILGKGVADHPEELGRLDCLEDIFSTSVPRAR